MSTRQENMRFDAKFSDFSQLSKSLRIKKSKKNEEIEINCHNLLLQEFREFLSIKLRFISKTFKVSLMPPTELQISSVKSEDALTERNRWEDAMSPGKIG